MSALSKLKVALCFDVETIPVGELVQDGQKIYFRFDESFLAQGLNISPIKLPVNNQIQSAPSIPFDGLFGVFADSLPDGWGRLLLDRTLQSKGKLVSEISSIDRLSFVGKKGMGALLYEPVSDTGQTTNFTLDLDSVSDESTKILKDVSSDFLEQLYQLEGSSGGARPKVVVGYNPKNGKFSMDSKLMEGYEHWLIKFSATQDRKDCAEIEFAYHKMALSCGIEMSNCNLFESKSGKSFFGTKRFDRIGNNRLHLHTAAGILHDDFRLSSLDYGHLLSCAFELEKHVRTYDKILRLAAFNVFACNKDDHSKNFSFLMDKNGNWCFAPAYDLTFSLSTHGFQSTSVAGESQNPGEKNLLKLVDHFQIKKGKEIIEQVKESISTWKKIASEAGVDKKSSDIIWKELSAKIKRQ